MQFRKERKLSKILGFILFYLFFKFEFPEDWNFALIKYKNI